MIRIFYKSDKDVIEDYELAVSSGREKNTYINTYIDIDSLSVLPIHNRIGVKRSLLRYIVMRIRVSLSKSAPLMNWSRYVDLRLSLSPASILLHPSIHPLIQFDSIPYCIYIYLYRS